MNAGAQKVSSHKITEMQSDHDFLKIPFSFRVNIFPKHGYIWAGRVYLQCCQQATLERGYHGILSKEGSHK